MYLVDSGFSHEGVSILPGDARGEYTEDVVKADGIGAFIGGLGGLISVRWPFWALGW
jgi:hypothetical protein